MGKRINYRRFLPLAFLLGCTIASSTYAEIRNGGGNILRVRVGPSGGVATVIYNAGIPSDMGGLPGVIAQPTTTSTNSISGGSGPYTVRFVTDVNARPPVAAPLEGVFSYDSSTPMGCTTPSSCSGKSISFEKISWTASDGDTLVDEDTYEGDAYQEFQTQTDFNGASNGTDTRHRNWYRYEFMNDELLPAGTYEGTVRISGVATN